MRRAAYCTASTARVQISVSISMCIHPHTCLFCYIDAYAIHYFVEAGLVIFLRVDKKANVEINPKRSIRLTITFFCKIIIDYEIYVFSDLKLRYR